jgi:tape measure domain-containing protein
MAGSVGHLYLDVKLQTDQVEAQLRRISQQWEQVNKQVNGKATGGTQAAQTAAVQSTTAAIQGQTRATQAATAATVQQGKAAQDAANKQVAASNRATAVVTKNAKKSASAFKVLGAGSQELFVGLGAARSGNVFYGLAAGSRYIKNVTAALGDASLGMKALAGGAAGVGIAIAAVGAAAGFALAKMVTFGVQSAANFQMLSIQLEGLLGSVSRARTEMTFLLELGKESLVPTQSLIAADRQLLAFGVTADKTRQQLVKFFSDFGTATGASEQQTYYLSLALGQVAAIGKANAIDMRQLANAGINTMQVYEIIGNKIGKSAQEVAAGVSEGLITADLLYAALNKYGKNFATAAQEARRSTQGLLANIKDTVTTELGLAFDGMNKRIGQFLEKVLEVVNKIDFSQMAKNVEAAIGNIQSQFGSLATTTDDVARFFNETLPKAINWAGNEVAGLVKSFMTLKAAGEVALAALEFGLHMVTTGVITLAITAYDAANKLTFGVGGAVDAMTAKVRDGLVQAQAETAASAAASYERMLQLDAALRQVLSRPVGMPVVVYVSAVQVGIANGQIPKQANDPQPDWYQKMVAPKLPAVGSLPSGSTGGSPSTGSSGPSAAEKAAIERAKRFIDAYKKLYADAEAARKKFVELVKQPFGEPSEIQDALTSGSVSTIIGMNDTLREQIMAFYRALIKSTKLGTDAIKEARRQRNLALAQLDDDTRKLITLAKRQEQILDIDLPRIEEVYEREAQAIQDSLDTLADWRDQREGEINALYDGLLASANTALDEATARYEEANSKLQDLINERDQFLNSVQDSLRSFVNGMTTVETEIQKYTRLDAVGSFLIENIKQTASFKDTLAERLQALRDWTADIRSLMARGLDENLIRDFVAAGVEGSGDVVAGLAGSDDATIAGINQIQSELMAEVDAFKKDASAAWFDAGIAQQEAYVAPLRDAMNAAAAYVTSLEQQRTMALDALKKSYEEQKEMYEQQLVDLTKNYEDQKKALEAELELIETAMQNTATVVNNQFTALAKGATAQGVAVMDGLISGMNSKEEAAVKNAKRIAKRLSEAFAGVLGIASPSKVTTYFGQMIGQGLIVGMNSMTGRVNAASTRLAVRALPAPSLRSVGLPTAGSVTGASVGGMALDAGTPGGVAVKVFIGDRELTDIVDYRIEAADARSLDYVSSGRRV